MKRLITAAALALLATTAHASQQLSTEGYWTTSLSGTPDSPICVSMAELTSKSTGAKGLVMLKGQKNGMYFHIVKSNWRLPVDVEVSMTVTFDTGVRNATGKTVKLGQNAYADMIEIQVGQEKIPGLLDDFANAKMLTFNFLSGNEPQWNVEMKGSRTAARTLAECTVRIGGSVNPPQATSPVGPQATSPVGPSATSPVAPKSQPVIAKPKDNGSI